MQLLKNTNISTQHPFPLCKQLSVSPPHIQYPEALVLSALFTALAATTTLVSATKNVHLSRGMAAKCPVEVMAVKTESDADLYK